MNGPAQGGRRAVHHHILMSCLFFPNKPVCWAVNVHKVLVERFKQPRCFSFNKSGKSGNTKLVTKPHSASWPPFWYQSSAWWLPVASETRTLFGEPFERFFSSFKVAFSPCTAESHFSKSERQKRQEPLQVPGKPAETQRAAFASVGLSGPPPFWAFSVFPAPPSGSFIEGGSRVEGQGRKQAGSAWEEPVLGPSRNPRRSSRVDIAGLRARRAQRV